MADRQYLTSVAANACTRPSTGRPLLNVNFVTNLTRNLCTALTGRNTTENINSHAQEKICILPHRLPLINTLRADSPLRNQLQGSLSPEGTTLGASYLPAFLRIDMPHDLISITIHDDMHIP